MRKIFAAQVALLVVALAAFAYNWFVEPGLTAVAIVAGVLAAIMLVLPTSVGYISRKQD